MLSLSRLVLAATFVIGAALPTARAQDPASDGDSASEGPEGLHLPPPLQPPLQLQPAPVAPPDLMAQIDRLERSGKRMRAGGAVMLAFGIALELTGQILILHSQLTTTQSCSVKSGVTSCSTDSNVAELGTGIGIGVAGAALLYTGPTVMSAGSGRVRRARFLRASFQPQVSARELGLRVRLTF